LRPTVEAIRLFHDGTLAFSEIEHNGIKIDTKFLDKKIEEVKEQIKEKEEALRQGDVYKLWKDEFGDKLNFGSSEQLAHILFDCMEHEPQSYTAKGKPATTETALETIDNPFVREWTDWKKLEHMHSSFLKVIRREVVDGSAHCDYRLYSAKSFRGSCRNFNFQNLPVRNLKMAEIVRPCVIPPNDEYVIVESDFTGIEVRVSACYNKDPVLMEYICDKTKDMHRDMASQIYMIDEENAEQKAIRYCGKNQFVFPQFYGSYYIDCSRHLWDSMFRSNLKLLDGTPLADHVREKGISKLGRCNPKEKPKRGTFELHVKEVEDDFWNRRFRVYTQWKKAWWNAYLKKGGFKLYTGFTVEGLMTKNGVLNYAVQGSAFHCLLKCLIRIQNWLKQEAMKTKIIGQIHDSLVSYVHLSELPDYISYIQHTMTRWLPKVWDWLIVPLEVEVEVSPPGCSWHEKRAIPLSYREGRKKWEQEARDLGKKMGWKKYKEFLRSINYPIPEAA
jgi:DNA polymerase I